MIISIVGTDIKVRDKAMKEALKLGPVSRYLYSEHIDELEPLIDSVDLFGGVTIVCTVSLYDNPHTKDRFLTLLPKMETSPNIFVVDEPFLSGPQVGKLSKASTTFFDAREEKTKDSSVFVLCLSVAKRDKKAAWLNYMALKGKEEGEKIAGALWWKWKEVWQDTLSGKKTAYTLLECEEIGGRLVRISLDAHRGKAPIDELIEKVLLLL